MKKMVKHNEIGRDVAFESVTVMPQVAGRVVERHFQDGENLRKGQLLFVIDPRPYKAQVDSAQAALAQAKAALDLARIQFARDQEVIRNSGRFPTSARASSDHPTPIRALRRIGHHPTAPNSAKIPVILYDGRLHSLRGVRQSG